MNEAHTTDIELLSLSMEVEITEVDGPRCDQLMAHILSTAFLGARAKVVSRIGDPVDITAVGDLPQITVGLVTTRYRIEGSLPPALHGSPAAIEDL